MGEYRLDTSWKAWRSRMKRGFYDTGAVATLVFAPAWAIIIGLVASNIEYGICTLIMLSWVAAIETFAGARVIRKTDEMLVGVLNSISGEEGPTLLSGGSSVMKNGGAA